MIESSSHTPLLTALVILPFVGAAVVALLPRRRPELARLVALLFTVAAGALSIAVLAQFVKGRAGFQLVDHHSWIPSFGINWIVGVDGISLFLVVLTGVLFPLAILGADPHHDSKPYYAWLLILEAGCFGVFLALDLFLFFVFFEIVLVPMYFLIGQWGHGNRTRAALKFFLFTMFGSAFMLIALIATAILHQQGTGGPLTFDLVAIATNPGIALTTQRWLFLGFAIAFAVKTPLFPVHTWLPDAHTEAPTAGSVILAGVMLKLGTYGLIRYGLFLFPEASAYFAPMMVTLGVIGITYGAIVATMQKDLKRLVAYSSIAHLGFIVLGTFALTTQGIQGGVVQMINHGLSTGALFLLVGFIYERRHTRQIARAEGIAEGCADHGGCLHARDAVVHRPAWPERLRRRVPHHGRIVPHPTLVDGRGRHRRHPGRAVPAVGVPARVPRRARRGQRQLRRDEVVRRPRDGAVDRAHRVPRRVPEAGARSHPAVGRRADRAHRGSECRRQPARRNRLPPARRGDPRTVA